MTELEPDKINGTKSCLALLAGRIVALENPQEKVARSHEVVCQWRTGTLAVGTTLCPDQPGRPDRPQLKRPGEVPKRSAAGNLRNRIALLHSLTHIELNAINLAWDIVARFTAWDLPREFYDDWTSVAAEETSHFQLLSDRLGELGATYGDLPAHDGLWEAASATSHDLLARLAIIPLILEARGLDVTPSLIDKLQRAGDWDSAESLKIIYQDEIGHVAIGKKWFDYLCKRKDIEPQTTWNDLKKLYFKGKLKPPFNEKARAQAGMSKDFYFSTDNELS